MAVAQSIKMTAEQYVNLGEDPPGLRLELVNGEIKVSASPATIHGFVLSRLFGILFQYVESEQLGLVMSDTDHRLTRFDVRRPDLFFFSADRVHLIDDDIIRHSPDLAVEIISKGNEDTDRVDKFDQYQTFGIPNYWLIDPQRRTADAFVLRRKKYVAAGIGKRDEVVSFSPFPDLRINLADLWWPPKRRR